MNVKEMELKARPIAIRMSQEIADIANLESEGDRVPFCGVIAGMVLQNIIGSLALVQFKAGGPEGENFIRDSYRAVLRDALDRWQKLDLKAYQKWQKDQEPK